MSFTLAHIPGFADISDAVLAHDKPSLAAFLSRISNNAAFGMVRLELFTGLYKNGDTVSLPTSPADNYNYQRNELMYLWVPVNTGDPATQWATDGPPWTMWYGSWQVNQTSGVVSCAVGYRGNNDHKDRQANTNDSTLQVFTIAQRNLTTLTLAAKPSYVDHADAAFYSDRALNQSLIQEMSHAAKYGVVNTEVIYMGVFKNGDTVPTPVSPADGYQYSYGEVMFQTSTYWTADDNGGSPATIVIPALTKGQLSDWSSSVSSVGVVSISVTYELGSQTTYNTGRVAVFAFCNRAQCIVPGTSIVWDPTLAGNSSLPYGDQTRWGTPPVIIARNLTPGNSITLSAVGLCAAGSAAAGWPLVGPVGGTYLNGDTIPNASFKFPLEYVTGAVLSGTTSTPIGIVGLMGAFTDASGVVKGTPVAIGAGGTFTIPSGATQLQLGCNDNIPFDNRGSFAVSVVPLLAAPNPTFVELASSTFVPGATLRASTMKTLQQNIRAAAVVPEFFGPTTYSDSNTVALPTSAIDAYAYSRSELTYVWDWANTGPDSFGTDRLVLASASIDSGGVVHISNYRFQSGATNWALEHNGSVRVLVIGKRNVVVSLPSAPAAQPSSGTVVDDAGGFITVNGV